MMDIICVVYMYELLVVCVHVHTYMIVHVHVDIYCKCMYVYMHTDCSMYERMQFSQENICGYTKVCDYYTCMLNVINNLAILLFFHRKFDEQSAYRYIMSFTVSTYIHLYMYMYIHVYMHVNQDVGVVCPNM